jgi:hypothetical protein
MGDGGSVRQSVRWMIDCGVGFLGADRHPEIKFRMSGNSAVDEC